MAVSVAGKILLDTNVFADYLRADLHAERVFGGIKNTIRFLSSIVLIELRLGADTAKRKRVVQRIVKAFPTTRIVAPTTLLFDLAGCSFRTVYGSIAEDSDRSAPMNDLLISLTAREIGATVTTRNLKDFRRIATDVKGLKFSAPEVNA